jgi:hypothetical protein
LHVDIDVDAEVDVVVFVVGMYPGAEATILALYLLLLFEFGVNSTE